MINLHIYTQFCAKSPVCVLNGKGISFQYFQIVSD